MQNWAHTHPLSKLHDSIHQPIHWAEQTLPMPLFREALQRRGNILNLHFSITSSYKNLEYLPLNPDCLGGVSSENSSEGFLTPREVCPFSRVLFSRHLGPLQMEMVLLLKRCSGFLQSEFVSHVIFVNIADILHGFLADVLGDSGNVEERKRIRKEQ
jgi:hypothetical protein